MKNLALIYFLLLNILLGQQNFYTLYNVDNGLSQNKVNAILQDHLGFMWFGTEDGLNKFDGYSFKTYRRDPSDKNSLGNNSITALVEDKNHNIWVGTRNGLYKFQREFNKFYKIELPAVINQDNAINNVALTDENVIAGNENGNVYVIDLKTEAIQTYLTINKNNNTVLNNSILALCAINNNEILVGTRFTGLNYINLKNRVIEYKNIYNDYGNIINAVYVFVISKFSEDKVLLNTENFAPLLLDTKTFKATEFIKKDYLFQFAVVISQFAKVNENILLGCYNSYLLNYNLSTKTIKAIKDDFDIVKPFSEVYQIYVDYENNIWIATSAGVYYYNTSIKPFKTINYSEKIGKSLPFSSIRAIYKLNKDEVLIGGYGGLIKYNLKTFTYKNYTLYTKKNINANNTYKLIPSGAIYEITPDFKEPNKYLWIGTEGQGLYRFDLEKEEFKEIIYTHINKEDFNDELSVYSIVFDKQGNMYIGNGTGIIKFTSDFSKIEKYTYDPYNFKSIQAGKIKTLYVDDNNVLWVGSNLGVLSYFIPDDNDFRKVLGQITKSNSFTLNSITDIFEDSHGRFWVATGGGGLILYDRNTGSYKEFLTKDGLPNDVVYAILEDDDGNLWFSTNKGLTKFNYEKKSFINYDVDDGLQANEFNKNAAFKDQNGELFFGGVRGITYFNPKAILISFDKPKIVFTSFNIYNKPTLTDRDISFVNEIVINPEDKIFSLEFAALNYYQAYKNKYKYRLIGLDDNWIDLGNKREVTFTDLNPNTYTLEIMAANNDNVWSDRVLRIKIIVLPPYYKSWWFLFLLVLVTGGLIIGYVYLKINESKLNKERLESLVKQKTEELLITNENLKEEINKGKLLIEQLEKAKQEAEQANKAKSLFLANISHEIRTPMNSVLGFAELLRNEINNSKLLNYINSIINSGKNLLTLIDDILDLARIDSGLLKLNFDYASINDFINYIQTIFEPEAINKGLYFKIENKIDDHIKILTDPIRLKQIIYNLASNAIKFTEQGGVTITCDAEILDKSKLKLKICVEDTGIGITDKIKNKIFEKFFQIDADTTRKYSGTGLGLSISKNLIYMLNGNLHLESEPGKGSSFCMIFNEIEYKKEENITMNIIEEFDYENIEFTNQKVLIVDDAELNRKLLKAFLAAKNLRIYEATNGEDAVALAKNELPDIIFMDLKMPIMDGYTASSLIKKDEKTKHIPIIALTAANITDDDDFNNTSDFDGYLLKPVTKDKLITTIAKYINVLLIPKDKPETAVKLENVEEEMQITEERRTEIKEQIFILRTTYLPQINNLLQTMIINNIENFASEVFNFAEKNNLILIKNWGIELKSYCANFDLPNIITTLNNFSNVIDLLEERIRK